MLFNFLLYFPLQTAQETLTKHPMRPEGWVGETMVDWGMDVGRPGGGGGGGGEVGTGGGVGEIGGERREG